MEQQFVQMLKESVLFSDLAEEVIVNEILPLGTLQDITKDSYLIHFQERFDSVGIVVKGKINLMHIYGNGNYGIMGILEASELLGADLACTKSRISPYYAVAMQQSQAFFFPADMILKSGMLREEIRSVILGKLLMFVADENMRKEYRLAILFQKGLRDRIMTFLTMQANKKGSMTFSVPFTRDEMASYLCVNRTCLSHELSLMEQDGLIKFHRNTFTLLNWEKKDGEY